MRSEEAFVRAVLTVVLLLFVWIVAKFLLDAGISSGQTFLLCAAIILLAIAFGEFIQITPKALGRTCMAGAIALVAIFFIVYFKVIPVCGDNVCGIGECGSCSDCSAAQCADNKCEAPERCDTSPDCACAAGEVCKPDRTTDARGCYNISCGDNYCDQGERSSCCTDCGCEGEFRCQENVCFFNKPEITLYAVALDDSIGATSLAGNPTLTDRTGTPQPLAAVKVHASGKVRQAQVTFSIDGHLQDTVPAGEIGREEKTVYWYPSPGKGLLDVPQDVPTAISIRVQGLDAQGDVTARTYELPMTLRSNTVLDEYGHIVLFVTGDINTTARTPDGIWDELRQNYTLMPHDGYQFPLRTLQQRAGSADDFGLLLTSAYESAGLHPILIHGSAGLFPDPKKVFVRVPYNKQLVTIDPARLSGTLAQAVVTTPGANFYNISSVRKQRNLTVLNLK